MLALEHGAHKEPIEGGPLGGGGIYKVTVVRHPRAHRMEHASSQSEALGGVIAEQVAVADVAAQGGGGAVAGLVHN